MKPGRFSLTNRWFRILSKQTFLRDITQQNNTPNFGSGVHATVRIEDIRMGVPVRKSARRLLDERLRPSVSLPLSALCTRQPTNEFDRNIFPLHSLVVLDQRSFPPHAFDTARLSRLPVSTRLVILPETLGSSVASVAVSSRFNDGFTTVREHARPSRTDSGETVRTSRGLLLF